MIYRSQLDYIEKEDEKIIGNVYTIEKKYYSNKSEILVFTAKLVDIKYNISITNNHSLVHHYYFDEYYKVYKNGIEISGTFSTIPHLCPWTSYVPNCDHFHLYSTNFYKKKPLESFLQQEIHTHAFRKIKREIEGKTHLPYFLLTYEVEEWL